MKTEGRERIPPSEALLENSQGGGYYFSNVTFFIIIGLVGTSPKRPTDLVGIVAIFCTTGKPDTTLPNTA